MITAEEFLEKDNKGKGYLMLDRKEFTNSMIAYAKLAIKTDRLNLLKHVKTTYGSYFYDKYKEKCTFVSDIEIDKNSLLNASMIELL